MPQFLLNVQAVLDALEQVSTVKGLSLEPARNAIACKVDFCIEGYPFQANFLSDKDQPAIAKRGLLLATDSDHLLEELAIAFKFDFLI